MGNVFSEKPLKEIIRENQRMIKKAVRELEKETTNLKRNETKLIADIKKMAKQGQMVCTVSSPQCNLSFDFVCSKQYGLWQKI
jgi:hypothetical protein